MLDIESRIHLPPNFYRQQTTKIMSPCRCCQNHSHPTAEAQQAPRLLRYDHPHYERYESLEFQDSRRVSVIKTALNEVPRRLVRRTNSVSSVDQQSVDSHSEKSFESRSPLPNFGQSSLEQPTIGQHSIHDDFYRSLVASPPRRERLTILQDENDRSLHMFDRERYDYRDIPSPNYSLPPMAFPTPNRLDVNLAFSPYLDANLRRKFTEFNDFSIKKRHRTIFTPSQLRKLEEKFNECNFIVGVDRSALAKQLKLKEHQVKIWFQNRRTKVKQQSKDTTLPNEIDVVG